MSGAKIGYGRTDGDLIYDWNNVGHKRSSLGPAELLDETLREGLQSPSVKDPDVSAKIEILHLAASLGIRTICLGLPGASQKAFNDIVALAREVSTQRLPITVSCSGRTTTSDIAPIVEISQKTGLAIEVYTFIGSSPIRALAEDWNLALLLDRSAKAIEFAVKSGLKVCYVTEDTTRSRPDVLRALFNNAVDHGATRLCLCDTVGHATPDGVRSLIQFARSTMDGLGYSHIKLDWHGHNDRGLALINALLAIEYGADRVHATALGIGERVGNTPMELLLLNLWLDGSFKNQDLSNLLCYCEKVSVATGFVIPNSYPLVGRDAFRTSTGVHAAAIVKAQNKGNTALADRVYSSVPADLFGRTQEIEIGPMSGGSNVTHWLNRRGIAPVSRLVQAILATAKAVDHVLTPKEIYAVIADFYDRDATAEAYPAANLIDSEP